MPGESLVVDAVSKSYGGLRALDNVSLDARPGEITGLIGPNGAGKTTLFDVITGYAGADTGTVRYGGRTLTGMPPHKIARAGVVRNFQAVRIFERLTGFENLAVAKGADRDLAEAREFLSEVGRVTGNPIPLKAAAGSLSFGNQKILGIGRCLAAGAKGLMLDEPAAALHDMVRDILAGFLRSYQSQERVVLLVEHDMRFVTAVCDRVFVLTRGQVLAVGTPLEIQRDPVVIEAYLGSRENRESHGGIG
jgi:branched-chain amino acid transport system ATP-binding protein